ncbi:MAG: hypothetical protein RL129_474 [Actinomycetota bacterium]
MSQLFVVAGPAASGKSEFAKTLSEHLACTWIDSDDNLDQLISDNKELIAKVGMESFLSQIREDRYSDLISKASHQLSIGKTVVISAPFTAEVLSQEKWDKLFSTIINNGFSPTLYWIATQPSVRMERIKTRAAMRDVEKAGSYKFESISPAVSHILIDGTLNFEAQIEASLENGNK